MCIVQIARSVILRDTWRAPNSEMLHIVISKMALSWKLDVYSLIIQTMDALHEILAGNSIVRCQRKYSLFYVEMWIIIKKWSWYGCIVNEENENHCHARSEYDEKSQQLGWTMTYHSMRISRLLLIIIQIHYTAIYLHIKSTLFKAWETYSSCSLSYPRFVFSSILLLLRWVAMDAGDSCW